MFFAARRTSMKPQNNSKKNGHRKPEIFFARVAGLVLVAAALAGCSSPAVRSQRLVAKTNMTISSSAAFSYNSSKLMPQLAPGIAGAGASQNSGCTSCR